MYESPSFEFDYFLSIIKYISFYYLLLGCLPLVFEKLKLNKNHEFRRASRMARLSQAISNYQNYNTADDELRTKEYNIFKNTNIIGGVDPKTHGNNLEFLIRTDNEENYHDDENRDVIMERDEE